MTEEVVTTDEGQAEMPGTRNRKAGTGLRQAMLKVDGDAGGVNAARQFMHDLLSTNAVEAVLAPAELPNKRGVVQALIRSPSKLDDVNPFAPVVPVNTATIVSQMTKVEPAKHTTAVFIRSCEMRALVELVKLNQASLENIVTVGVDCLGTYPVTDYAANPPAAGDALEEERLRSACTICYYPSPMNVDISLGSIGMDAGVLLVQANTQNGLDVLKKLGYDSIEHDRTEALTTVITDRKRAAETLYNDLQATVKGLDGIMEFLAPCINCHNCMTVCPVCYCRECFFESPTFDVPAQKYHVWAGHKGRIRMPTDTLLYHLTRMTHMVTSCVACGMCEQACPSGIELLKLYATVGHNAQLEFEYEPGRDFDEPLPLTTYREEELQPR